jgi:hypothetical protein
MEFYVGSLGDFWLSALFGTLWGELLSSIYLILPTPLSSWLTQPLTEMSTRDTKIMLLVTTLPPSLSRLSRQCRIFDISQPDRPPRPVTGKASLLLYIDEIHTSQETPSSYFLLRARSRWSLYRQNNLVSLQQAYFLQQEHNRFCFVSPRVLSQRCSICPSQVLHLNSEYISAFEIRVPKGAVNHEILHGSEYHCLYNNRKEDHSRKIRTRKQRTDFGKYSFVNRTIIEWLL